tara:strand:- start:402 stop:608 length:207 start_codon:yes stop_codon:yes gene_type:complete
MGKVKQWAWDTAEEQSDNIIKSYVDGNISKQNAISKLSNVENLDLVDINEDNVEEVLEMAIQDKRVLN